MINIQLIFRKLKVPRAKNAKVVLKPGTCQSPRHVSGLTGITKVQNGHKTEELNEVFGLMSSVTDWKSGVKPTLTISFRHGNNVPK